MSLTTEQAAGKFCPLVNGPCKAGDCHFWMWDEFRTVQSIPWPENIARPTFSEMEQVMCGRDELLRMLFAKATDAVRPLVGTETPIGQIVEVQLPDKQLMNIRVVCVKRDSGDCCMRRAAERKPA